MPFSICEAPRPARVDRPPASRVGRQAAMCAPGLLSPPQRLVGPTRPPRPAAVQGADQMYSKQRFSPQVHTGLRQDVQSGPFFYP